MQSRVVIAKSDGTRERQLVPVRGRFLTQMGTAVQRALWWRRHSVASENKKTTDVKRRWSFCDVSIFNEIDGTRTRSLQRDKLQV